MTTAAQLASTPGAHPAARARPATWARRSTTVVVTDPVHPAALPASCARRRDRLRGRPAPVAARGGRTPPRRARSWSRARPGCEGEPPLGLLMVDPAADWSHVTSLARTALSTGSALGSVADDSLFSLADALAALCGGPVVVHDAAWQLLAYSGGEAADPARAQTLLGRRAPARVPGRPARRRAPRPAPRRGARAPAGGQRAGPGGRAVRRGGRRRGRAAGQHLGDAGSGPARARCTDRPEEGGRGGDAVAAAARRRGPRAPRRARRCSGGAAVRRPNRADRRAAAACPGGGDLRPGRAAPSHRRRRRAAGDGPAPGRPVPQLRGGLPGARRRGGARRHGLPALPRR